MANLDERTPLSSADPAANGGTTGAVPPELKNALQRLFRRENLQQARAVAAAQAAALHRSAGTGDAGLRLLALAGGAALVASALLGIASHLVFLQLTSVVIECYVLVMGIVMIVLESKQVMLPERFLQQLYKYALFLRFVWGRGCLYLVAGTLQLSLGALTDVVVGGAVGVLGIAFIQLGRRTAVKLRCARSLLSSEYMLRDKVREASERGQDALTYDEFRTLMSSLGVPFSQREAEAAFLHVSTKDQSEVSYDEIRSWWEQSAEPGLADLSV